MTVNVGPEKQAFAIHEDLLKSASKYFQVALDGKWTESKDKTFNLDEENAAVFGLFVQYLYNNEIKFSKGEDVDVFLVEAYLFAERREASKFKNAVMDALKSIWVTGDPAALPTLESAMLAFSESLPDSKLRKLIADKWAWVGDANKLHEEAIHPEFALEVFREVLVQRAVRAATVAAAANVAKSQQSHHGACGSYASHYCQRCYQNVPLQKPTQNIKEAEPPYLTAFCATYHDHETGDPTVCNSESCQIVIVPLAKTAQNDVIRSTASNVLAYKTESNTQTQHTEQHAPTYVDYDDGYDDYPFWWYDD